MKDENIKCLKNIIVVYDCAYINGGAAKVAIQSAIALAETRCNVYYFAATGPVCKELRDSKVHVKCLYMNDINHGNKLVAMINGIWNNKAGKEFRKMLNHFSRDDTIVHIHGWAKALSSSVVYVATKSRFKTLITLHDYFTVCPNGGLYNYKKQQVCKVNPMSIRCVVCNCDKRNYIQKLWRVTRQFVQDKNIRNNPRVGYISISQKNEDVIKSYVKSSFFARVDNPIELSNKKNLDCTKSIDFVYVGRLSDEKGIELFCQAIEGLDEEGYKVVGRVIGDGVLSKYLHDCYKKIIFEGWKNHEDVLQYYQNARALVLPSKWYEGAPLSIIEALSAGIPCIVSNVTSATEIIKPGMNGEVFISGNLNDLKKKILHMMDDNYIKELQNNISRIDLQSRYSEEKHCDSLIEVYYKYLCL